MAETGLLKSKRLIRNIEMAGAILILVVNIAIIVGPIIFINWIFSKPLSRIESSHKGTTYKWGPLFKCLGVGMILIFVAMLFMVVASIYMLAGWKLGMVLVTLAAVLGPPMVLGWKPFYWREVTLCLDGVTLRSVFDRRVHIPWELVESVLPSGKEWIAIQTNNEQKNLRINKLLIGDFVLFLSEVEKWQNVEPFVSNR